MGYGEWADLVHGLTVLAVVIGAVVGMVELFVAIVRRS